MKVLATTDDDDVHLATSPDGFRTVFFQGHPEYDTVSLLKEYKRDVNLYIAGELEQYPPMPDNYFSDFSAAVFREYQYRIGKSLQKIFGSALDARSGAVGATHSGVRPCATTNAPGIA